MDLQILWFVLIAVLWGGYFVLEGFDFGVGMLLPFLPRDERERGAMFESIGPVWDGNEVWLVVAGGATFAAFPAWYATMFSGFYLALLLILFFLIIRVLSFEWREKSESPRWRKVWLWANTLGSFGAPFVWGVALANLLHGVPLNSNGDYAGDFCDLFTGYTVLAGIAVVCSSPSTARRTSRCARPATSASARRAAARLLASRRRASAPASSLWTVAVAVDRNDKDSSRRSSRRCSAIVALVLAVAAHRRRRRSGWAFALDGARRSCRRRDAVHEPLSAGHGLEHRISPTASPSTTPRRRTTRSR